MISKLQKLIISFLLTLVFTFVVLEISHSNDNVKKDFYNLNYKNQIELKNYLRNHEIQLAYIIPELKTAQIVATNKEAISISKRRSLIKYINKASTTNNNNPELPDKTVSRLNQWDMKQLLGNNRKSFKNFKNNAKIGIIDTGVEEDHPDIKKIGIKRNLVPRNGYRNTDKQENGLKNQISDVVNHGTAVTGQISANNDTFGILPNSKPNIYRVFDSKNSDILWLANGIVKAADDDNDVINISIGSYIINNMDNKDVFRKDEKVEFDALQNAINYAYKKGTIVVAANGNNSVNLNNIEQLNKQRNIINKNKRLVYDVPAMLDNVVSVGSVDKNNELSSFSNYGKGYTDIVSVGGSTKSFNKYGKKKWAIYNLSKNEDIVTLNNTGGYDYKVGNSIASPKVTSAIALIIDKYDLYKQPDKTLEILYKNGTKIPHNSNSNQYDNGILDMDFLLN